MNKDNYKDQFISHMVNEVQTPLKAILKFSEGLIKNPTDINNQEKYLKLIHHSAKNLENIINDVSDISKIQEGTLSIHKEKINLRQLLSQNFEIFRAKAKEKYIRYSIAFGKDLPEYISTDELRLSQVISNLLSNAIKFTPDKGFVKLEVVYNSKDSILKIFVDDNGPGIPKSKQDLIFKPFIDNNSSTSFEKSRTGLGLSISLSIIELLNGKMSFKSTENEGSTFSFEIPVNINN